jgi:hypothetical protein
MGHCFWKIDLVVVNEKKGILITILPYTKDGGRTLGSLRERDFSVGLCSDWSGFKVHNMFYYYVRVDPSLPRWRKLCIHFKLGGCRSCRSISNKPASLPPLSGTYFIYFVVQKLQMLTLLSSTSCSCRHLHR